MNFFTRPTKGKYHSHPDVKPWVVEALSNERLYEDGDPSWNKAETSDQAQHRRLQDLRRLKQHIKTEGSSWIDGKPIADRLDSCEPGRRCLSGACPECMRAMQRYVVGQTQALVKAEFPGPNDMVAVCLICQEVYQGNLERNYQAVRTIQQTAKRVLRSGGVKFAVGGLDLSLNEDRQDSFLPHWSFHLWLLVPAWKREKWELELKVNYIQRPAVPRPVKIVSFDGNAAGFAYALKTSFVRRESYQQVKENGESTRICQNTRDLPLRKENRIELFNYLDEIGLAERVFLMGARPTKTESGYSIVRLGKTNQ